MTCRWPLIAWALILPALVFPAAAQTDEASEPGPPHISFVDGAATLEREGRSEAALVNMPLVAGDRIQTGRARLEVLFPDATILHLDEETLVDVMSESLLRLISGRLLLTVSQSAQAGDEDRYRIDSPGGTIRIRHAGEYRLASSGDTIEVVTLRGWAELVTERGSTPIRAGELASARAGEMPTFPQLFNSASFDAFDRWSQDRRQTRIGTSARSLPPEVAPYTGTFDRHGVWVQAPAYGYVWYPQVNSWWRPYYNGRWVRMRRFGLTWVGAEPWAWPTHHFGRWSLSNRGTWFWIPARGWRPAWVSWAVSPRFVGWCPLGLNGGPAVGLPNVGGLNIYQANGIYAANGAYDPWVGWTLAPRDRFAFNADVPRFVVSGGDLDPTARAGFVLQRASPFERAEAAVRSAASPPSGTPSAGLPLPPTRPHQAGTAFPRRLPPAEAASILGRSVPPRPDEARPRWSVPPMSRVRPRDREVAPGDRADDFVRPGPGAPPIGAPVVTLPRDGWPYQTRMARAPYARPQTAYGGGFAVPLRTQPGTRAPGARRTGPLAPPGGVAVPRPGRVMPDGPTGIAVPRMGPLAAPRVVTPPPQPPAGGVPHRGAAVLPRPPAER